MKGGFWFTLGSTLTPSFNAYGAYAADPNQPAQGLGSPGFHASFGNIITASPLCVYANWQQYRFFPPLHGASEFDLSRLRFADKPGFRGHLPRTTSNLRYSDRLILAHSTRTYRNGRAIAGRRRRLWLPRNFGRLVDLSCSNARFRRLSISDPRGRHQPLDHSLE